MQSKQSNGKKFPPHIKVKYFHARELLEEGREDEAETVCDEILTEFPSHPRAWHLRGMIYLQKDPEVALNYFKQAIEHMPGMANFHASLGYAMSKIPSQRQEALNAMMEAIELAPQNANYYRSAANLLKLLNKEKDACVMYRKALALDSNADLHYKFAKCLRKIGEKAEAVTHFRAVLDLEPNHEFAAFWLATLTGRQLPSKCPENYIQKLYDGYASKFEEHLVGSLGYQTPTHIANLLAKTIEELGWIGKWKAGLDLGCGTGLSGSAIKRFSDLIVGVDLSAAMVEEAKKKNLYSELHVADILDFIRSSRRRFDLFVACDVFVYLGDLDLVLKSISMNIADNTSNAVLAFSTESLSICKQDLSLRNIGYVLTETGRYAHSKEYLLQICNKNNFTLCKMEERVIRKNGGKQVNGFLVICSYIHSTENHPCLDI